MVPVGIGDESEAIAADHRTILHDDARAKDAAIPDGYARVKEAIGADARARTDDDVRVEHGAAANVGAGAHDSERSDRHVVAKTGVRRDDRAGMNTWRRHLVTPEHTQRISERSVRVGRAQHRAWRGQGIVAEDDCRCAGLREQRRVFRIGEKGEIARAGVLDARRACDVEIAVAVETTVEPFGEIAKLQESGAR